MRFLARATLTRVYSLPQVDLMVQALESKGERPLVVIAEKYIDRVGDPYDNIT